MNQEKNTLRRNLSKEEIQESYSKVAWFYDQWGKLTESRAIQRVTQLANIQDGEHILEVAVGTGVVFEEIVKRNPNGQNEGIDLSPSMLQRAEERLKNYNINSFHLQVGSVYQLPFVDNTFDLLINNFMLDLLPEDDFSLILSEMKRVLKPSGRVVISTMAFGEKWYNKIWFWIAKHFPNLLTGCRPISLESYILKSGFENVIVEKISQNTFPAEVLKATKGSSGSGLHS
jgi:ubiquinone/menaquinone biosynthesis C-methylase UbiE